MAGFQRPRVDVPIFIDRDRRSPRGQPEVQVRLGDSRDLIALGPLGDYWRDSAAAGPAARATSDRLKKLTADLRELENDEFARLAYHIDPDLARFDWEAITRESVALPHVRRTNIWPTSLGVPFTLPLRITSIGSRSAIEAFEETFGGHPETVVAAAVTVRHHATYGSFAAPSVLTPRADVIHLGGLPRLRLRDFESDEAGSLGWFLRTAIQWQVRLITIEVRTADELADVRELASKVGAHGGPSMVAASSGGFVDFFRRLFHDTPLDEASLVLSNKPLPSLVHLSNGGADAVRLSQVVDVATLAVRTEDTGMVIIKTSGTQPGPVAPLDYFGQQRSSPKDGPSVFHEWAVAEGSAADWTSHETGALLPAGLELERSRQGDDSRIVHLDAIVDAEPPGRPVAAFLLNASTAERVDQNGPPITAGEDYLLSVGVGSAEPLPAVLDMQVLLDELLFTDDEAEGVWLAVGVTGIDVDVRGSALQPLWVPRRGPSSRTTFTVVAPNPGIARFRFTVYLGTMILQSFRGAVRVADRNGISADDRDLSMVLSGEIDDETQASAWLTKLEYHLDTPAQTTDTHVQPDLSIVSNDFDSETVTTIRGRSELFEVRLPGSELPRRVAAAREALDAASKYNNTYYRYGSDNTGQLNDLALTLTAVARAGSLLFGALFPGMADEIRGLTNKQDAWIQVAHTLAEKSIPWSLVYDQPYAPARALESYDGRPLKRGLCPVGLRFGEDAAACGTSPECLVHESNAVTPEGERYEQRSVLCARRFWGFAHRIEVPTHEVRGGLAADRNSSTAGDTPVTILGGKNDDLALSASHLAALATNLGDGAQIEMPSDRDEILAQLVQSGEQVQVVYFYCHAGELDNEPTLIFGDGVNVITADEFDEMRWTQQPLVVLNGCRTAGFSPDALSPFVRTMVLNCGASGAIGTETAVFEQLAGEVAQSLLKRFVAGESVGRSLLAVRRSLLVEKNNPLGLTYTLYAPVDLSLQSASNPGGENISIMVDPGA